MATINDDLKSFRRSWVHHTGMQLATLSVLTATFFVVVFGYALSSNLKRILASWGDSLQMVVYLREEVSTKQVSDIRIRLEELAAVRNVEYVPSEAATAGFKTQMASYAPGLLEDADFANSFPASFRLSLKNGFATEDDVKKLEELSVLIEKVPGVEDVSYGQSWIQNYSAFVSAIYASGGVLGFILLAGSLFVVGNSIRVSISARREEIEILELVGATASMIRRPFIVEGFIMGTLASVLAIVFNLGLHLWQKSMLSSSFILARVVSLVSFLDVFSLVLIVISGALLGALGAWLTVRRINDGWSAKQGLEA